MCSQRGHVVLGAGLLGQRQQPVELGRHHVRAGHPVLLDEREHLLGDPLVHQHHGVEEVDGGARVAQDGGVVERRADDVHVGVVGLDAEQEEDPRQPECRLLGGGPAQLAEHPLGIAGGPRGVVHHVADGPIGRIGGRSVVAHGGVGAEAGDLAHREATGGGQRRLVGRIDGHLGEPLVGDEGLGAGVLQDVGHLGPDQVMVDGNQVPAGLQGGQIELEHLHAVGEEGGHHVPRLELEAAQAVHHLVGATEQPLGGVLGPVGIDQRQLSRVLVGQRPKSEVAHGVRLPPAPRGGCLPDGIGTCPVGAASRVRLGHAPCGAGPMGTLEQVLVYGQPPAARNASHAVGDGYG